MRHHLWEKVRYQHKVSAPSTWFAIIYQEQLCGIVSSYPT